MEFDLTRGMDILSRTPDVLRVLLADIDSTWSTATEGPDTWSPYDIVGHLIHGERTDWIPRARIILEHGTNRVFEPYDRFAQFHESEGKSLTQLLDEFAEVRAENLRIVTAWKLDDHQLALQGQHPALGVVTLRQLLSTWVSHDLGHLAQVARVMAKQYRDEVGPWRAYLSVMDR
ncbi:MAG: DinB family protein [Gemmatimonadaceae bacterium]|nr:DinB family protein [Gemmatimonadaceae bacterium]